MALVVLRLDALDPEGLALDGIAIGVGGGLVRDVELIELLAVAADKPRLEHRRRRPF